jgi:hypothetical protein
MGGGGRGGRTAPSMPRMTWFKWTEVGIGRIQAITPAEGEAAAKPLTDQDHLKKVLQYDVAKARGDKRPVLVYFHWPHDHKVHGKLSTTVCSRTLDDEMAARWSQLFRCVQVDMGNTVEKYANLIGNTGQPLFVALDDDLKVVDSIPVTKSGSKLRKSLEGTFKKFPKAVKQLKKTSAEHRKLIAEAKKLEKQKRLEDAVAAINKVRFSKVRVTKEWTKARSYGMLLAQKAERAMEKGG